LRLMLMGLTLTDHDPVLMQGRYNVAKSGAYGRVGLIADPLLIGSCGSPMPDL